MAVLQVDRRPSSRVHLVSCYMHLPEQQVERTRMLFFQELDNIISSVPSGEMNVLLGDFDARVGSRENVDEEWSSVRGPHGFGCANDSGKELLTFLALHPATVCKAYDSVLREAMWVTLRKL